MLDIGWAEMAMVALLALIVVGPKDLPKMMRTAGQWMRKARSVAREFQSGLDDMMRESELDEARQAIEKTRKFDVKKELDSAVDPSGDIRKTAKDVEDTARSVERDAASRNDQATPGGGKQATDAKTVDSASTGSGESEQSGGDKTASARPETPKAPGNSIDAGQTGASRRQEPQGETPSTDASKSDKASTTSNENS